jgi:hypothetical protein
MMTPPNGRGRPRYGTASRNQVPTTSHQFTAVSSCAPAMPTGANRGLVHLVRAAWALGGP